MTPQAKITGIEITHHRLPLDPPFNASWDTQPRTQPSTPRSCGSTPTPGSPGWRRATRCWASPATSTSSSARTRLAIERHWRILEQHPVPLGPALAARPGALGPRRQAHRPARVAAARRPQRRHGPKAYASSGTLRAPAELADAAEHYLALGLPGAEDPLPSRRLAQADIAALEAVRARVGAQARTDGRLQPGMANVLGRLSLVER